MKLRKTKNWKDDLNVIRKKAITMISMFKKDLALSGTITFEDLINGGMKIINRVIATTALKNFVEFKITVKFDDEGSLTYEQSPTKDELKEILKETKEKSIGQIIENVFLEILKNIAILMGVRAVKHVILNYIPKLSFMVTAIENIFFPDDFQISPSLTFNKFSFIMRTYLNIKLRIEFSFNLNAVEEYTKFIKLNSIDSNLDINELHSKLKYYKQLKEKEPKDEVDGIIKEDFKNKSKEILTETIIESIDANKEIIQEKVQNFVDGALHSSLSFIKYFAILYINKIFYLIGSFMEKTGSFVFNSFYYSAASSFNDSICNGIMLGISKGIEYFGKNIKNIGKCNSYEITAMNEINEFGDKKFFI